MASSSKESVASLNNDTASLKNDVSTTNTGNSNASELVLDRKRLQELVREVDPCEQLDEDVEELLLHIADDFIEQLVTSACSMARHRKADAVETKDVQFVLEKQWNLWLPGFGTDELKPPKRSSSSEAHKARMAVIKKALKKY